MSDTITIYAAHLKNEDLVINYEGNPTTVAFDNASKAEVNDQELANHICNNWPKSYRMSSFSATEKLAGKGASDRQKAGSGKGFRASSAVKKTSSDAEKKLKEDAKKKEDAKAKKVEDKKARKAAEKAAKKASKKNAN